MSFISPYENTAGTRKTRPAVPCNEVATSCFPAVEDGDAMAFK